MDYALAEAAFFDPDLLRRRRHKETVKAYLTDESVDPVPLRRLTTRHPDTAIRVIRAALGKPGLGWERDGEQLLRKSPCTCGHDPAGRCLGDGPAACGDGLPTPLGQHVLVGEQPVVRAQQSGDP